MAIVDWVLLLIVGLLAAATAAPLAAGRGRAGRSVYAATLALSLPLAALGLAALVAGSASTATLPLGLPWLGAHFRLDALSGFFLLVVNLGGAAASLYGLGYAGHEDEPRRVVPFYAAFLAGMNLVLVADDAFTFLFAWEAMSLASWALVMARPRDPDNAHAGYVYLVMAGIGTFALLLGFGVLAGAAGDYGFAAMRAGEHPAWLASLALVLVLVGAGSKAGLVPLHVWLPLAHPAAPSHVSALMSGVMTKVAVYGFVRIVFDLVGSPLWWWGALVVVLGAVTALLGVLYALMQHDLKRLLAYHTVENIGIIFIGLGLALAFRANGLELGAALAATAALFHVFNHSLFKSLLFFGAGAVLSATGERDMERLGGLIRRMPQTAFLFLVGCVAISALPPLNGFVSEWLTFQAVLLSPDMPQWLLRFVVPAAGAMLALSAALAAACFVKAYGITFLGRPRSEAAAEAREVDRFSIWTMAALAALCLLAGVLPGLVVDALGPAVALVVDGARLPVQREAAWLTLAPVAMERGSYNGLLALLFIALSAGLVLWAMRRWSPRGARRAPAWDCGFPDPSPTTQYTAGSFAQPIRRIFATVLFRARERVDMPQPGETRAARFEVEMRDPAWDGLVAPVATLVGRIATRLDVVQTFTIRRYLSLVFGTLVLLLIGLTLWR